MTCHGKNGKAKIALQGYNVQALCNLDRPEKSLLLRAPLPEEAGGLGICGPGGLEGTDDPAYRQLLAPIRDAARQLAEKKRFDMPAFRPNKYYIREMQRFGFLPQELKPDRPVDYYATDQAYWKSFWWQPADTTMTDGHARVRRMTR